LDDNPKEYCFSPNTKGDEGTVDCGSTEYDNGKDEGAVVVFLGEEEGTVFINVYEGNEDNGDDTAKGESEGTGLNEGASEGTGEGVCVDVSEGAGEGAGEGV